MKRDTTKNDFKIRRAGLGTFDDTALQERMIKTALTNTADLPLVRQLGVADLDVTSALQETVKAGLPQGFIRSKSQSQLETYLDGTRGVAYGIIEDGVLLAASLLSIPDKDHTNAGLPFPLVPAEDWPLHACFLENTMVLPLARGRGYQRILLDARLSHASASGMRWVCAGVHLENSVSWANLLSRGMIIAGIRFDFGYPIIGLLRSFDALALTCDSTDQIPVRALNAFHHEAALKDGYIGVRLASDCAVIYQKVVMAQHVTHHMQPLSAST